MILKLENNLEELVRVNEKVYKDLKNHDKTITIKNIPNLILEYPILLQRPIIVFSKNDKVIKSLICRPTKRIKKFLNEFLIYGNLQ